MKEVYRASELGTSSAGMHDLFVMETLQVESAFRLN